MSRQPLLRLRTVGRLTIGLLGVAAALLVAPAAVAQPEVDANDAITAAWQASGGDTGPLGPKSGDVYPVGPGFAQNFASGKAFFTPATGAHLMQGAILDKYDSLGGAADSDLGFPTIDEGPGRAPDSRNTTFSASDNPVIFWTPDNGAHVVRGPLNAAWDKLGGSTGVLGVPAEDETYDGAVVSQKFTGGEVSYDAHAKKFTTVPPELADQLADLQIPDDPIAAINAARRAAGGPTGPLGAPQGDPYKIGDKGYGQDFGNGKIFYSPDTGANVVTGQVLAKYESVGGPTGDLGFPITGEVDGGLAPSSRMSAFAAADKPVIFWTPDYGAVIVRGAMHAAWDKLGGATGTLGAPVADQSRDGDVISQKFSGGAISYNTSTKKFTTEPGNLAPQLAGLQVPGAPPPQAPPAAPATPQNKGSHWSWWWLLAIIPVVLLVAVVAFAVARNRRHRSDDADLFGPPYTGPTTPVEGHEFEPAGSGAGPEGEGREDAVFGDRYAREGLGSLTSAAPPSAAGAFEPQEDPDAVDTAPTRVPTASEIAGASGAVVESDREPLLEADEVTPPEFDVPEGERPSDTQASAAETLADNQISATETLAGPDAEAPSELDAETLAGPDTETPIEPGTETPAGPDAETAAEPDGQAPVVPAALLLAAAGRDSMTDTGRHARIDVDEPAPMGTALHMPLDDPHEMPDGYPIKADTRTGLYWTADSVDYAEAPAEIWFASEEMARTNGFVRGE